MIYSGLFRRLFAFTIDVLLIICSYVVLGFILGFQIVFSPILTLPMLGLWFFGGMISFAWLYFALQESSKWQATLGKRVLGLKVVNLNGERITFIRASVRYFSKIISRAVLMIGFLMILFTKKKQALHDKIAKTLIIKNKPLS